MTEMMGKRELNKARKREAIVQIASRAFLCNGYAATSMSSIADTMGGSKATLWAHFSSKEELFAAVIDAHVDAFSDALEESLADREFSMPAVRRAALGFLEALLRPSSIQLFRLVVSEGERFPEISEMFYSRGPARARRSMREFLETRLEASEARRLTHVLIAALSGYRSDILVRPDKPRAVDRARFVDDIIATIEWPELPG